MKKAVVWCAAVVVLFLASAVSAAGFTPYPGSKVDDKATMESREAAKAAHMTNVRSTIYTTTDTFQKVCAFYKAASREIAMPRSSGTAGNEQGLYRGV